MILNQPRDEHKGKIIASIEADNFDTGLVMCQEITIRFTDGTSILLEPDWRGSQVYISQKTN